MYISTNYNTPLVKINLEPGIYEFDGKSATGKTYLAKRLHELRGFTEPVDSFTYNDSLKFDLEKYLDGDDFTIDQLKVVLLDRYDRYTKKYNDTIQKLSKYCVVLLDCKGPSYIRHTSECSITFNQTVIEVS
jgi:hypothetical protein